MKINTKKEIVDFDGNAIKNTMVDGVGKVLAKILASEKNTDPLRAFLLAKDFYTKDEVELNASDVKFVSDAVKASVNYTPLTQGQLLELLK